MCVVLCQPSLCHAGRHARGLAVDPCGHGTTSRTRTPGCLHASQRRLGSPFQRRAVVNVKVSPQVAQVLVHSMTSDTTPLTVTCSRTPTGRYTCPSWMMQKPSGNPVSLKARAPLARREG